MKTNFFFLLMMLVTSFAFAQVQIDKSIQMTGATNAEKQITGVGNPAAADHAANAGNIQSGALTYAGATGAGGNYEVALNPVAGSYAAGMIINFVANHNNTGSATLKVNALAPVSIKKSVSQNLAASDIVSGQAVSVMYDGTNFQLLSSTGNGPTGGSSHCYTCDGW
jgi:hypothetical protein